jgi:exopolysaccharide biosynthesis polyprenyl glycosylphosphotransferase
VERVVTKEDTNPVTEAAESTAQVAALTLVPKAANRGLIKTWVGSTMWPRLFILGLITMDTLALLVGFVLAGYLASGENRVAEVARFAPILLAMWFVVFVAWDLYVRRPGQRSLGALLGAVLSGMGLLLIVSIVHPSSGLSLEEVLLATLIIVLLEGGLQLLYKQGSNFISSRGLVATPTLIIGEDEERARIRQAIEGSPGAYTCVGELNTHVGAVDLSMLRQALDRTGARNIILAGTDRLSQVQFPDLLRSLRLRKVRVKLAPAAASALVSNKPIAFQEDSGVPLLEVGSPRLDSFPWMLKRMLDVVGSLGGLIVLSPLLIMVAILIKLTSPGPVFFRQKRVGADEKIFTCYKFRSMYEDAERRQAELEGQNEAGGVIFKIKNDPRITPIGRFIRDSSIDELPQLINVLKGEMSLVGPRPLPLRDFERMGELDKKRLGTVPGITGFWQVSGRSDLSFEEMLRLDLYYIENWALSLDMRILFKTIMVVLRHSGAY